jgi:murein tripeptide amidase MpaA
MNRLARRIFLAVVPVLLVLAGAIGGAGPEIVSVATAPGLAARLAGAGLDLLLEHEGRIFMVTGPVERLRLAGLGISFAYETDRFRGTTASAGERTSSGGLNGAYHSYLECEADLQALERDHPGRAKVFTLGTSLEGRNISALRVSDNAAADEPEPALMVLGCHHAREWISVEVPLLFARHLLENYDRDPDVRGLVDGSEIWVVPLVNPDGLEYTIHAYRYWRKNRRLNSDGSFGIDLNRNYAYAWGYDDSGSSPTPASDVYRGAAPFSEPETGAVRSLFLRRDVRALVSYHSYSQVILYPWGFADAATEKEAEFDRLAAKMSDLMRAVNGRIYDYGRAASALYVTNGDTTDWAYAMAGIPAFTIELPPVDILRGGFFNPETDIAPVFRENLPALLFLARYAASGAEAGGNSGHSTNSKIRTIPARGKPEGKFPRAPGIRN